MQVYITDENGVVTENLTPEFRSQFEVKNVQHQRMPTYVKQYAKFNKLSLYISNYIYQAIAIVEQILNSLNIKSLSGDVLQKVLTRYGVNTYTYAQNESEENAILQDRLRLIGIKRKSLATLADYEETTAAIADIVDFEIVDLSCISPKENQMNMAAIFRAVTGNSYIKKYDIQTYLNPMVTGLQEGTSAFQYGGNIFSWDQSSSRNVGENLPDPEEVGFKAEGWGPAISTAPEPNENETGEGYAYPNPGEWR